MILCAPECVIMCPLKCVILCALAYVILFALGCVNLCAADRIRRISRTKTKKNHANMIVLLVILSWQLTADMLPGWNHIGG